MTNTENHPERFRNGSDRDVEPLRPTGAVRGVGAYVACLFTPPAPFHEPSMHRKTVLSALTLMGVLALSGHASAQEGSIWSSVPAKLDPESRYLIYLHGQIIETGGRRPTSPQFGVYEYDAILQELARSGLQVISEARPAGTRVAAYAEHVAEQVRRLLAGGVPAERISVVGFSKGGMIAATASSLVRTPRVRYVIMAGCTRSLLGEEDLALTGAVLSIHEASDDIGLSCEPLFERSPDAEVKEIRIDTGARHGAFYRPRPEWMEPALAWIGAGASREGRRPAGQASPRATVGIRGRA